MSRADDAHNEDCRWSSGRDSHEVPEGSGLCSAYSDPVNGETCQSRTRLYTILGELTEWAIAACQFRLGRPRVVVDLCWAELRIGAMCSGGVSAADDAGVAQLRRHRPVPGTTVVCDILVVHVAGCSY